MSTATKQKYLGQAGLVAFITVMNMFIPLSTDLYLPALPSMSGYFQVSATLTNLTLVSFFFFYAVGTLLWGPPSDKYGRRPILLIGTAIYVAASVGCALSVNVYMMIAMRILQGLGAGSITSVSMALIRDCFQGQKRENILAVVQSMAGIAPMIAPIIGALILQFATWRATFWLLAIIGALCLITAFFYQETLPETERYEGTLLGSLGRLVVVGRQLNFLAPAVIFALYSLPFMGYIAISSYIYVDYFGLSEQVYSYFFAANACVSLIGPVLYVKFFRRLDKRIFATASMILAILCGAVMLTVGKWSPWLFLISFAPFSLMGTAVRPFSTNMMLDQVKADTGSASSLINAINTVMGSIGMVLASMAWSNIVTGLGMIIAVVSVIELAAWLLLMRSRVQLVGVDKG